MPTDRPDDQSVALAQWGDGAPAARVAILAVHGRGQNPEVMQEYSARFAATGAAFFAPRAPGDSWYPEPFLVPMALNAEALERSLDTMQTCLRRLRDGGWAEQNIVVWGFSQGACLLSHYLLTRPSRVGGAVLFTGGYVGEERMKAPAGTPLRGLPIVVRTIEDDPLVPSWRVTQTVELLRAAGADVDFRIDPGHEHVIAAAAFSAADDLLARLRR